MEPSTLPDKEELFHFWVPRKLLCDLFGFDIDGSSNFDLGSDEVE